MKKLFLLAMVGLLLAACERPEPEPNPEIIRNAVEDVDGNQYDAVKIGNQVWLASNLKTEHYADGGEIPMGGNTTSWTEPYRYCPDGNSQNVNEYGYLYNWSAAMHGTSSSESNPSNVHDICPEGWHVPSKAEWNELEDYVDNHSEQYGNSVVKALASNNGCWTESEYPGTPGCNQASNNTTGFSVVPAGYYSRGSSCGFGEHVYFWSSTEADAYTAWSRSMHSKASFMAITGDSDKDDGFSVRCLRD